ncbi:MAG: class I SAM-dependent methyltransferase [Erysipelotrichaceae bacterium]|nr:class I SAM-dependent methyltransferase [Erysipelotrichaceae bacterium]
MRLHEIIEGRKSIPQLETENKFINDIVDKTAVLKSGYLIDIATGRGMLLKRLIERVDENVHIISADLSFAVLEYDRLKFKESCRCKVSYIACDATELPLKDDCIDMICTFTGYLNMGELYEEGLCESRRVLKKGGSLIDSLIYMDEKTKGYAEVKRIMEENGMGKTAEYIVRDKVLDLHQRYFNKVKDEISYEGIGEETKGDLLPYPGEWYENAIIEVIKDE